MKGRLDEVARDLDVSISPPTGELQEARERLVNRSDATFDRAYMQMMLNDHERIVRGLEGKMNSDGNEEMKEWASTVLPTAREHLRRAQLIADRLDC
jgi:putative membrane protein